MKQSLYLLSILLVFAACQPAEQRPASIGENTQVITPTESVPAEFSAFSGVWVGSWGGCIDHKLAVQTVDEDGKVNAVYAVGDHCRGNFEAGSFQQTGQINGNVLTLDPFRNGAVATYTLREDGGLEGAYDRDGNVSRALLVKS